MPNIASPVPGRTPPHPEGLSPPLPPSEGLLPFEQLPLLPRLLLLLLPQLGQAVLLESGSQPPPPPLAPLTQPPPPPPLPPLQLLQLELEFDEFDELELPLEFELHSGIGSLLDELLE
jgi:hypothetical protein